jgi:hypothetical protein
MISLLQILALVFGLGLHGVGTVSPDGAQPGNGNPGPHSTSGAQSHGQLHSDSHAARPSVGSDCY